MKHPRNRAERREARATYIARRRFIYEHIFWHSGRYPQTFCEWGRYAKFNLGCGCKLCHYVKYYGEKRKRRRALDQAILDNLKSWE